MNERPNILVADDQQDVLHAMRLLLKEKYEVTAVNSPGAVLRALERTLFDLLIIDLNYTRDTTSASEGLELLSHVHAWDSTLPIVVMTAWGSIDIAVEAMKRGARDFVQKPWENERLQAIVSTQVELGRALRHGQRLEIENRILRDERYPNLIAQSPVMRPVLEMI
ncbi:MAG TPA: response regulator, partial [Thermoanaerobaculia bacterium]|nr:response regulator [Thermoanaerobaculia bacterium]